MNTYCICLTSAYGEILCICKLPRIYQNRFKVHHQCGFGVYHKQNEENVMHSAGHRKNINNIKSFVRILVKLPMKKKTRENIHPKFQKKKAFHYEQFLIEWKIIFIALSDIPWMLLILLRTCVTCVMDTTPMLHWNMDEKALYMPVFAVAYNNHCIRVYI